MEMWESVVRMMSALGVVLALILGLLAVARSAVGRRFLPVDGAPLVKILGSGPLGSRKHVMVVAVAGEVLILGTTATELVPLGKINDPEVAKRLIAEASALYSGAPTGLPASGNLEETARAHS
ncbi:MAG TPA: flagellar biosynthetic protein FliO [Nitrospira sp.]|nr:flagellar biosynthetic protein FliO [Nitrospira sp.]